MVLRSPAAISILMPDGKWKRKRQLAILTYFNALLISFANSKLMGRGKAIHG
jgi:hypothetical protein